MPSDLSHYGVSFPLESFTVTGGLGGISTGLCDYLVYGFNSQITFVPVYFIWVICTNQRVLFFLVHDILIKQLLYARHYARHWDMVVNRITRASRFISFYSPEWVFSLGSVHLPAIWHIPDFRSLLSLYHSSRFLQNGEKIRGNSHFYSEDNISGNEIMYIHYLTECLAHSNY